MVKKDKRFSYRSHYITTYIRQTDHNEYPQKQNH